MHCYRDVLLICLLGTHFESQDNGTRTHFFGIPGSAIFPAYFEEGEPHPVPAVCRGAADQFPASGSLPEPKQGPRSGTEKLRKQSRAAVGGKISLRAHLLCPAP